MGERSYAIVPIIYSRNSKESFAMHPSFDAKRYFLTPSSTPPGGSNTTYSPFLMVHISLPAYPLMSCLACIYPKLPFSNSFGTDTQ